MIDANATIINNLKVGYSFALSVIQFLLGGVFGIYIILAIIKFKQYKEMKKFFKEAKHSFNSIEKRISGLESNKKK